MDRDVLIVEAVMNARREIERRPDKDRLQMYDLIHLAVQYGTHASLTFEEIDDALNEPLSELVCF